MGKNSQASIKKLISDIDNKINDLLNGSLSVNQLDDLVNQAADLHERLAVLRFLAFEKLADQTTKRVEETKIETTKIASEKSNVVEPIEKFEEPKNEEPKIEEPAFDFSLINNSVEEKKPEAEVSHELDFSTPLFSEPVENSTPVTKVEIKKPIEQIHKENKQESSSLHEKFLGEDFDLNDKLKRENDVPLRKKLGLTPIADLKAEIGIGKKFEYINFLFAGDAKAYETAISELNNAGSKDAAKQKLNVYASVYNWDLEDKNIVKFIELVERRHL